MPKTKRRRCKAGCEPAAPRGPRDQRVPSCPCSPAASRVPARSWGAGDPETPRDRSKESATEAARPWSGGGHTWKREGAQGPRRRVPVFPSPLLSRRPVRPVPPDPTADSRCRDPQRPARADAPFPRRRRAGTRNPQEPGTQWQGREGRTEDAGSTSQLPAGPQRRRGRGRGSARRATSGHLRAVSQRSFGGANALPHSTERGRVCDRHGNVGINRGFSKRPGSKKFQTNCKGVNVLKYIIKFKPYYN